MLPTEPPAAALLEELAASARLYRHDGRVLLLHDERALSYSSPADLGGALIASGVVRPVGINGAPVRPDREFLRGLGALVLASRLPELEQLVRAPALLSAGDALFAPAPGLEPASRALVLGTAPTARVRDYPLLRALFSGIPAPAAVRANLTAWTVAAFARAAFREAPFLLVAANRKSVGKSRTVGAIGLLLGGRIAPPVTFSGDEARTEFTLAAWCGLPGPNFVAVDNVRAKRGQAHVVRSQALSASATAGAIGLAPKGKGVQPLFAPVIALTMNDARLEADLADKALLVELGATGSAPVYLDPDPVALVEANREALLVEVVSALEGLPTRPPASPITRFGSWERVVLGVAERTGLPVDLSPELASGASLLLHQAYECLLGCSPPPETRCLLTEFLDLAETRSEELRGVLSTLGAANRHGRREIVFRRWAADNLLGRPFRAEGRRVQFALDESCIFLEILP